MNKVVERGLEYYEYWKIQNGYGNYSKNGSERTV